MNRQEVGGGRQERLHPFADGFGGCEVANHINQEGRRRGEAEDGQRRAVERGEERRQKGGYIRR